MPLSIKANFTPADLRKEMEQRLKAIDGAILQRLTFIGERFIANARSNGTYKDQTGNLRSSIGYVVLKDGRQLTSSFPGASGEGRSKGQQVANEVAAEHANTGFVLIVVAGMEYAAAVEARNYDVLTASSITAKNDLVKAIEELKRKLAA